MTTMLTRLPVYATSFIGRDRAGEAVLDLFHDESVRLLTLVGASGSGKTRLSVQIAAQLADSFADGCVFVSLAPVTDPDLVLITIAHTLELSEQGAGSVLESLVAALQSRRMLLILDNMEQVRSAASQLQALLEQTAGLRVIVTSQVALDIPAETVYAVPPLALPQDVALDIAALPAYSAIALFIDRMREVQPKFTITPENSAAIVEICQLVEGLPLAIELIAAHSFVLTPQDLLFFLNQHLSLGRMQRSLDSRARIIRPILDWCVSRLEPAYQQVFLRLGVFVGGWTLESAAAVCNAADDLGIDIVEAMETLHAKHLILEEMLWGREQRYLMLDTVHEYAQQRLRTLRQLNSLASAHAQYFAALADQAYQARDGGQQSAWLERLEHEYHNIRAALRWRQRQRQPPALGELCRDLGFFWRIRGYLHEGRQWLTAALEQAEQLGPALSAELAYALSLLLLDLAEYDQAQATLERGLQAAQAAADPLAEANILDGLGRRAGLQGQAAEALGYFEQGLDLYRRCGNTPGEAMMLSNIALTQTREGCYAEALAAYEQALLLARATGNLVRESIILTNMGLLHWNLGEFSQGLAVCTQALAQSEELGDQYGIALNTINLGELYAGQGQYAAAETYLKQGIQRARAIGVWRMLVQGLINLAGLNLRTGNRQRADELIAEALATGREHGVVMMEPYVIEHHVRAAIADGRWPAAARLLGFGVAHRRALGIHLGPSQQQDYEKLAAEVRGQLAAPEWDRLVAEGETLTLDQAIAGER